MFSALPQILLFLSFTLATSAQLLHRRDPGNSSVTDVVANCVPVIGPVVGCSRRAMEDGDFSEFIVASRSVVDAAGCVCFNVFAEGGTIIENTNRCASELVDLDPQVTTAVLGGALSLITGNTNFGRENIFSLATGLEGLSLSCNTFSFQVNAMVMSNPGRDLLAVPQANIGKATLSSNSSSWLSREDAEKFSGKGTVRTDRLTDSEVEGLSAAAIKVVSDMQMPFAVNGVPIKDVAATRGETAKATSGATVATKGSLFGLLCVVAVVIVGLL